ncbi:hypothetical protein QCA50_007641 [Cerrena zonata]|uniref:F-box domain-containing protein n=1 Tax=Cerrena zonata TaxID=2478898 RepID=A0AAW0G641_9APHY
MIQLPPELIDRIIDFLHNDLLTLDHTSLVCHAWLDASRYHLHREFTIEIWSVQDLDNSSKELSRIGALELSVRHYVRVLTICGMYNYLTVRTVEAFSIKRIQEFIGLFPKLENLTLIGLTLTSDPAYGYGYDTAHSAKPYLEFLDLRNVGVAKGIEHLPILHLVSLFSQINRLRIRNDRIADLSNETPPELPQKSSVRFLYLPRPDMIPTVQSLLEHAIQLDALYSFTSTIASAQCVDHVMGFLNSLHHESLQRIELKFLCTHKCAIPVWPRAELSTFRSLQELHFRLDYTTIELVPRYQWSCMMEFLETIPVLTISKIWISLHTRIGTVHLPGQLADFLRLWTKSLDWHRLRSRLQSMPALRHINFHIVQILYLQDSKEVSGRIGKVFYEEARKLVQKELEEFGERKMLYISQVTTMNPWCQ